MSDQPKPTRKMTWTTYTKGETEIWVCGANSIVFDGPDRKANADIFIRAQHMGELERASRLTMDVLLDAKAALTASQTAGDRAIADRCGMAHLALETVLSIFKGEGK